MMDELKLIAPERVGIYYDTAGLGSRFVAFLIDSLILAGVFLLLVILNLATTLLDFLNEYLSSVISAVLVLLGFVVTTGYYIFFELAWAGESPGKRAMRLRVVRADGRPPTFVESLVRNLVRAVDFLPLFYGLGGLVAFIDQRGRRLGDLAAGTMVVKERVVKLSDLKRTLEELRQSPASPVAALSAAELALVRRLLGRKAQLQADAYHDLVCTVAERLAQKAGRPLSRTDNAEEFLRRIAGGG